jgi:hypothetical protein
VFPFFSMVAACLSPRLMLLYSITLIVFEDEYKSLISSFRSLAYSCILLLCRAWCRYDPQHR